MARICSLLRRGVIRREMRAGIYEGADKRAVKSRSTLRFDACAGNSILLGLNINLAVKKTKGRGAGGREFCA